jgi:hypothetical protein
LTQVRSVNIFPREIIEIHFELPSKMEDLSRLITVEESWNIRTISLERHKKKYDVCEISVSQWRHDDAPGLWDDVT